MSDLEFKVIEQADAIEDGDYILTLKDGVVKKVAKADANLGIQVDWDETDEDSPAFILNKPDVSTSGGSKMFFLQSGYVYGYTESGGIRSINTSAPVGFTEFASAFADGGITIPYGTSLPNTSFAYTPSSVSTVKVVSFNVSGTKYSGTIQHTTFSSSAITTESVYFPSSLD